MFEGSGRLDAAVTFPALAEAISAIPVRPDRGAGSAAAEEARALLLLRRQLDARLLGRVAAVDEQGLAAADGFASTAAWVRAFGNLDPGQASGILAAARMADRLPALGDVVAEGKAGVEHLQAVAAGAPRVLHETLAVSATTLAMLATHARPSDLRRAAAAIQARTDADAALEDADHRHHSRRLTLARTFDDIYYLEGLLEPEAGAALAAALEPLMAKRGPEDKRTVTQRRADALLELTSIALRSAELPDCGGDRPRLTFLVRTNALGALGDFAGPAPLQPAGCQTGTITGPCHPFTGQVGISAHHDTGGLLIGTQAMFPWETIARIGCDADVSIAAVNNDGEILNYGRTRRYPTSAQRRALTLRDQGCVFPGCDRPPALCQAHHLIYWSHDGPTDLDNLALICSFHHHLLHEGNWQLVRSPGPPPTVLRPHRAAHWTATAPDGRQHREERQPAA